MLEVKATLNGMKNILNGINKRLVIAEEENQVRLKT